MVTERQSFDRLRYSEDPHDVRDLLMRKLQILNQGAETLGVKREHVCTAIGSCPNCGGVGRSLQQACFAEEIALPELPHYSVSFWGAANDLAGAAR